MLPFISDVVFELSAEIR